MNFYCGGDSHDLFSMFAVIENQLVSNFVDGMFMAAEGNQYLFKILVSVGHLKISQYCTCCKADAVLSSHFSATLVCFREFK